MITPSLTGRRTSVPQGMHRSLDTEKPNLVSFSIAQFRVNKSLKFIPIFVVCGSPTCKFDLAVATGVAAADASTSSTADNHSAPNYVSPVQGAV